MAVNSQPAIIDRVIGSKPREIAVRAEYQVKGELLLNGDSAFGWCWSPDRKNIRLRVDLLIDGVRRGTFTAARLRLDLVQHDICDGYHGFSIPLPFPMPSFTTVEARESITGTVFGRVLSDFMHDVESWQTEAGNMSHKIDELNRQVGALAYSVPSSLLRRAFGVAGCWLGKQSASRIDLTSRKRAALRLPVVQKPAISFILDTGAGEDLVLDSLQALAPLLTHYAAEVIVSDPGSGAARAELFSIHGLSHCLATRTAAAVRSNQAASTARGETLIFLRPEPVSLSGIAKLIERAVAPQDVVMGGVVELAARRAGLSALFAPINPALYGFGATLIVRRELFASLGALDPALEDGAALPMLDFALRARKAQHDVVWVRDITEPPYLPFGDVIAARQRFATRWGS